MMRREAWLALLTLVPFAVGGCGGTSAIMPAAAVAYKGAYQGRGGLPAHHRFRGILRGSGGGRPDSRQV